MNQLLELPVLDTEHLILRRLVLTDSPALFAMRSDERMHTYTNTQPDRNIEQTEAYIRRMNQGVDEKQWCIWAIVEREIDRIIGTISLWNFDARHGTAELGYCIAPAHQGRGRMKEALTRIVEYGFQTLNIQALEAYTEEGNAVSARLLERCGFCAEERINEVGADGTKVYRMIVYRRKNPNTELEL